MLKFADFLDRINVTGDQSVEEAVLKIVNCPQGRQSIQQHWNPPSSGAEGPLCYPEVIKMNKTLTLELEKCRIYLKRIGDLNQKLRENQSESAVYREKYSSLDAVNRRLLTQLLKSRKCIEDMHSVHQEINQERRANTIIAEQSLHSKELLDIELEKATRQIQELHKLGDRKDEMIRQEKQQLIERLDEAMMKVQNLEGEMVSINSKQKDCALGLHQRDALLEQMVTKLERSRESLCKQRSLLGKYRHSTSERSSYVRADREMPEIASGSQNPAQSQSTTPQDDFTSRIATECIQRQREFLTGIVSAIQSLKDTQTKIVGLTNSRTRINLKTQSLVARQMAYITNSLRTLAPMRDRQSILAEKISKCCKDFTDLQKQKEIKYPGSNTEDDQRTCDWIDDLQLELDDAIYDRDRMEKSLASMTKQRDYFQFAALESRNKYVLFVSNISIRERRLMQTTAGMVDKYRTLQEFCKNRKFRSQRNYFMLYQQLLKCSELVQTMKMVYKAHSKQMDEKTCRLRALEEARIRDLEYADRRDVISSSTESRNSIKWKELLDGSVKRLQYDLEKLVALKSLSRSKDEKSQKVIKGLLSSVGHLQKLSEEHHAQNDAAEKRWRMASNVLIKLPQLSASLQSKNTTIENLLAADKLRRLLTFNFIQTARSGMHQLKDQLAAIIRCKDQLEGRGDRVIARESRHRATCKNIAVCIREATELISSYRSVIDVLRQKNECLTKNNSSQSVDLARSRVIVTACKNQSVQAITLVNSLRNLVILKSNETQTAATRIDSQLRLIQELSQMHRNSSHCIESFKLLLSTLKSRHHSLSEFVDKLHHNSKQCEERVVLFHRSWIKIATDLKQSHKDKIRESHLRSHIELISGRFKKLSVLLSDISGRVVDLKKENESLASQSLIQSKTRTSIECRCSKDRTALKMSVNRLYLNHTSIREFVGKSREMMKGLNARNAENVQSIKVTSLKMTKVSKIIGMIFAKTQALQSLIEANRKTTGSRLVCVSDRVTNFLPTVRILIDRARKLWCQVFDLVAFIKRFHLGVTHAREGVQVMCIRANRICRVLLQVHAQRQTDLAKFSKITHGAIENGRSFSSALLKMKNSYLALCRKRDILEQKNTLTDSLAKQSGSESQRVNELTKAFIIDSKICVGQTMLAASACGRDVHQLSLQREQLSEVFTRSQIMDSKLEVQLKKAKDFSTAVVLSHNAVVKSTNNFLEFARTKFSSVKYLHNRKNAQLAITFSKLRSLHDYSHNQHQKISNSTQKIIEIKDGECKKWNNLAETLCQEKSEGERQSASYQKTLETANEHITEGQSLLKCNQLALQAVKGRVASLRVFFERCQERSTKMGHELSEIKVDHEKLALYSGEITNELSSTEAELIQAYGFIRLKLEQDQLGLNTSRTRPEATKISLENELTWLRKLQSTPILDPQDTIEDIGGAALDTRSQSSVKEARRSVNKAPKKSKCYLIN
ncbi:hypothetical protein PSACC_00547 [Paramicrosporidium saccamoebae]|uniref:Uncharacterized protein n=1 Tax=Paramicrosporidium saccamoebae TaxID=1246581 RepID=A0A2H9TPF0_9FUNG|nr:hypothetical protein PSACC_00547 [Paramicrosporidium saccamoebae]